MAFYIARFKMSWADEFDVHSVSLLKPAMVRHFNTLVNELGDEEMELYFGTNHGWNEPVSHYAKSFTFQRISSEMYNSMKRLGLLQFGPSIFEQLMETLVIMKEDKDMKPEEPIVPHETNTDNPVDSPKPEEAQGEMTEDEKKAAALAALNKVGQ